jgi:bile acid-coenzyme A ligase
MATPIGSRPTELATARPDEVAIVGPDATLTWAALDALAMRLAAAYQHLGVGVGDLVSIALPNGAEVIAATFATWKLGATPQLLPASMPPLERDAVLALAAPALLVGAEVAGLASVPVGFDPPAGRPDLPDPPPIPPALKAMTSGGSTGRPKLIVSGTPGVVDHRAARLLRIDADAAGVQLVSGPLHHNGPFQMAMTGLLAGQRLVVLPRFDAVVALEAIATHGVTFASFVPTMLQRMARAIDERPGAYDVSSLRAVWHLAAPCPPWLKERWIELIGPDRLFELYSGTEAQAMTMITGTEWLSHRGSVGRPVVGEIVVLDDDGQPTPPGTIGEVYMRRGAEARPSYHYRGATARRRGSWESLGDLGWLDEDGYLYLADRRTDLILCGGSNVYPAEVEAALLEHPAVESAVVVGLPDDDLGQRVHAVVQAPADLSTADLDAFLAERLVRYKRPRSYRLVDHPLRDDAGKVRRQALATLEAEAS